MLKYISSFLGLFFSINSYAQSVDSHGFQLSPSDGDLKDPISVWRSEIHEAPSIGGNILFEYAKQPLVLHQIKDGVESEKILVDNLSALNLGLFYGINERLSFAFNAPLYLSTDDALSSPNYGLGDLRSSVAFTILKPKDDLSVSVSAIPYLEVPTMHSEFLSSSGVAGGIIAATSLGEEKWDITANLGLGLTPQSSFYNLKGKEKLLAQLSTSYLFSENFALRAELIAKPSLRKNDFTGTESPVEIMPSLKSNINESFGFTAGFSKALNRGVSAANWRIFAGIDVSIGDKKKMDCPECKSSNLWIKTIGKEPEMSITDGNTDISVKHGTMVKLPPGGDYLLTVKTEPCVQLEKDKIILLKPILFDFDQATIRMPDSYQIMTELVDTIKSHPEIASLEIATGTDVRGSAAYNMVLSERRAQSVVQFLIEHGVSSDILSSRGYGESRLMELNCKTEECHEKNRYSEVTIKSLK